MPSPEALKEIRAKILDAQTKADVWSKEITLMKRAGIDATRQEQEYKKFADQLTQLKTVYG